jgi:hypothetical protein
LTQHGKSQFPKPRLLINPFFRTKIRCAIFKVNYIKIRENRAFLDIKIGFEFIVMSISFKFAKCGKCNEKLIILMFFWFRQWRAIYRLLLGNH